MLQFHEKKILLKHCLFNVPGWKHPWPKTDADWSAITQEIGTCTFSFSPNNFPDINPKWSPESSTTLGIMFLGIPKVLNAQAA